MRAGFYLVMTVSVVMALLLACAPSTPTAAPTQAPAAPTAAAAPAGAATTAPAAATAAPKPAAATATPAAKIKRGGTLKSATAFAYPTLDPILSSTNPGGYHMLMDPLISFAVVSENPPKGELQGELAESFKIVDPKTVELKLRQGVKFSDGSDFNAEVAKWNLERDRTHPKSQIKENLDSVDTIEVVDNSTIRLRLKGPSAAIFYNLVPTDVTYPYMISKAAMDKAGEEEFGRNPVGTGPMTMVKWARDDYVEMKARKDYWKKGADGQPLPYVDSYFDYYRADAAVTLVEMKAGAMDVTREIDAKDVANIKADQNLRFIAHPMEQAGYFGFGMSPKVDVFQKKNVRLALQYGVDRDSMAKALSFGTGTPHYVRRWAPGIVGYEEGSFPKYEYNPDKVKQLLNEAGYPNGIDITMQVINRPADMRMSEMVKSMWDKVGIRTTLDVSERLAWTEKMYSLNFQVSSHRPSAYLDPDMALRQEGCGAIGNWFGWCNKSFDQCMVDGRSTYDQKERHEIYKKCINIMIEDAWTGVSYRMPWNFVYNKRIQNFQYGWGMADLRAAWVQ